MGTKPSRNGKRNIIFCCCFEYDSGLLLIDRKEQLRARNLLPPTWMTALLQRFDARHQNDDFVRRGQFSTRPFGLTGLC